MKSLLILFLGYLCLVQATHFRFGTMSWKIPQPAAHPTTVQFSLNCIFRYSYFTQQTPAITPMVGHTLNFAVADSVNELQWGDGTSQNAILGLVTAINMQQDSVTAVFTGNHTYTVAAGGSTYTAYFKSHARLSTLQNNANDDYLVSTLVTLFTDGTINSSPVSSSLPIIPATQNTINHIQVSASDAESTVTFALSTAAQQGQTGSVQPPNFSIDVNSGVITWDTNGVANGLWNAQVRITDIKGAFIVLDFLLNLTAPTTVPAPVFIAPSPAQGALLTAVVGTPLHLSICASDSDTNVNVIESSGALPTGVVYNPGAAANPICVSLDWTPTPDQAGSTYSFPFEAQTTVGSGTASLTFSIKVPALPTAVPTDMPSAAPTMMPSAAPTDMPTMMPSAAPTDMPTMMPSAAPTAMPTDMPSAAPTATPTGMPSMAPTGAPTGAPTPAPNCGDHICSISENCATCPVDCNRCPQVIYHRATGNVVTATSFGIGATINLTMYDGVSRPNINQAWFYETTTNRITLCQNKLILGAGPVAQKQALTVHHISWDFKGALENSTIDSSIVHEFNMVPVTGTSNPTWYYLEDKLFNGNGNFAQASCLMAPYAKSPANVANQEVWGPNCLTTTNFQFRFQTFQCANGVVCGC